MRNNDIILAHEELRLFAASALGFCKFAIEHWYAAAMDASLTFNSSGARVSRRAQGEKDRARRFVKWMRLVGDAAQMSATALRGLVALEGETQKTISIPNLRDLRMSPADLTGQFKRGLLNLDEKSDAEFILFLTETQRDVIRPIESQFRKLAVRGRITLNRSTRQHLSKLAQLLDHLEVHVTCLKEIVEGKVATAGKRGAGGAVRRRG